jgi:hypothetical protein
MPDALIRGDGQTTAAVDTDESTNCIPLTGALFGVFVSSDKATDKFKGVGVGAWGSYVVWENSGFHEGHLHEVGHAFDSGRMTQVSRSDFERISDSHYVVHDFQASGQPTDTEDCTKIK